MSSGKRTRLIKGSVMGSERSMGEKGSHYRDTAPNLKVRHATNSLFQSVNNYIYHRRLHRLQTYSKKMAAKTSKYLKQIETLMKPYKFDDKDLTTTLRFFSQFRRG